MRFVCCLRDMEKALASCRKVIRGKATHTCLEGVHIHVSGDVWCTGSNLEAFVRSFVDADVQEEGDVVVPAQLLAAVLGRLRDKKVRVTFSSEEWDLVAEAGTKKMRVVGSCPDDYPAGPSCSGSSYSLPGEVLLDALRKTAFSASTDDAQPYLNGVCWERKGEHLFVVSTDGRTLSRVECDVCVLEEEEQIIVPLEMVDVVSRLLSGEDSVTLSLSEKGKSEEKDEQRFVSFSQGGTSIIGSLVLGDFPSYDQVFPTSKDGTAKVGVADLLEAVRDVELVAGEARRIRFLFCATKVVVSASSAELGESSVEIPAEWSGDESIRVDMGSTYLTEYLLLLKARKIQEATVDLSWPLETTVVEGEEPKCVVDHEGLMRTPTCWKQPGWGYLVMPMREV